MNHDAAPRRRSTSRHWRTALLVITLPTALCTILWAANVLGDSNRIPAEIAASARETGVMLCAEGAVDHDDAISFWDRIARAGTFRCTSWQMRGQASSTTTGAVEWASSPRRR
jgi:hypothetical protein